MQESYVAANAAERTASREAVCPAFTIAWGMPCVVAIAGAAGFLCVLRFEFNCPENAAFSRLAPQRAASHRASELRPAEAEEPFPQAQEAAEPSR